MMPEEISRLPQYKNRYKIERILWTRATQCVAILPTTSLGMYGHRLQIVYKILILAWTSRLDSSDAFLPRSLSQKMLEDN